MQSTTVKYLIIFLLLLIYINRSLFITPFEVANQGNQEINSVIEWISQLVTGESNDIDEDGDMQTDCNCTQFFLYDFPQHLVQVNLFSKEIQKIRFPYEKNFLLNDLYNQIDQPPES